MHFLFLDQSPANWSKLRLLSPTFKIRVSLDSRVVALLNDIYRGASKYEDYFRFYGAKRSPVWEIRASTHPSIAAHLFQLLLHACPV